MSRRGFRCEGLFFSVSVGALLEVENGSRVSCHARLGDGCVASRSDGGGVSVVNRRDGDVSVRNLAEKEIWRLDFLRRKEIGKIGTVARSVRTTNRFREVCRVQVVR